MDFIDEARNMFSGSLQVSTLTYLDYIEDLMKFEGLSERGYKPSMANDEKVDFFSKLSRDSAPTKYWSAKSFFVKSCYPADSFVEAQKMLLRIPEDCAVFIDTERGAIGQRSPSETVYVHRDVLFNFKIYFDSRREDGVGDMQKWMNELYETVKFMDSGASYQNYPEPNMGDHLRRYYGGNLEKLIEVKRKWDPKNYFNSKLSLPIRLP